MKCLPTVQSLPSEKQLMRYSFIFIVVLLLSLWKVQGQSIKHQIGLGNSIVQFQDWYYASMYFNPSLRYMQYNKNGRFKWGGEFGVSYNQLTGEARNRVMTKHLDFVSTRKTFSLDIPLYFIFGTSHEFAIGLGLSYRFRVDDKLLGRHYIDPNRYFHDIGFAIPITYQKKLSKRLSLQLQGVFRQYHREPNSLSLGLGILYNGYRKMD
jgi:hypothetical protein